ncbi:MAG: sigma factor-like helix-turn-helix DNA-binding protein [Acidobacteriota bacterium]
MTTISFGKHTTNFQEVSDGPLLAVVMSVMAATAEEFKTLDEAFRAALLFTGNPDLAERAVLDGIAALEFAEDAHSRLVVETVKSAIWRRGEYPDQTARALERLPRELQRLNLLSAVDRDVFLLRILVGLSEEECSEILHMGIAEIEVALCAALQQLPYLEARAATRTAQTN